jgi:hypothetical protein
MEFLQESPAWISAILAIVTASTAITALTPTQTDNKVINIILSVLNLLAGNVGKNKNEDDPRDSK